MKIKWINKISNDTGYVKKMHTKDEVYFENTYVLEEACDYKKPEGIIKRLNAICPQNTYEPCI